MTRTQLLLLVLAGCVLSLGGAFFYQYVLAILPCHLCLLQRYPFAVMGVLALLALVIPGKFLPQMGALAALVNVGLGIYHSGVERKFWAGPSSCTGGQDLTKLSGSDLLSTDFGVATVMCDEINYSIMGLTFANVNVVLSLVLFALWARAVRKS